MRKILIRDHGNRMTVERVNLVRSSLSINEVLWLTETLLWQAFRDISPDRWNVFTDSTELYNSIQNKDAEEDSDSDPDTLLLDESTARNE